MPRGEEGMTTTIWGDHFPTYQSIPNDNDDNWNSIGMEW